MDHLVVFLELPINTIFPLSVVYGVMGWRLFVCKYSCMYVCMHQCMYISLGYIYVSCMHVCMYVYAGLQGFFVQNMCRY